MPDSFIFEEESTEDLTKEQKRKLAKIVNERWRNATGKLWELIEDSSEGWDFYLRNTPNHRRGGITRFKPKHDTNTSQRQPNGLRFGLIPRSVDSVLSIVFNALFPSDERFFRGTAMSVFSQEMQEMYEMYRTRNYQEDNTVTELKCALLNGMFDPAFCLAVPWKKKTRDKVVYEPPSMVAGGLEIPIPILPPRKKTIKDHVEWEGTQVQCLDFNDWRVDPDARSMEDTWFTRRWYMPVWQVEEMYGLEDVEPAASAWELEEDENEKRELYGLPPIDFETEEEAKKQALLMISYDDFEIDGEIFKNHAVVTLNGKDVVWFGPNPYNHGRIPYIVSTLVKVPNQIYGLPYMKHALPSAAVIDTAVEKSLKISALAAEPIFEVDATEPAFRRGRTVETGQTYPVKRPGAIRQVQVNVANLSILLDLIQRAEDNIREVTGASPIFTGDDFANSPANITAFQIDQHIQGANSRFQVVMKQVTDTVLEPLLFITFENDKQFKSSDEFVSFGGGVEVLTPDMIKQLDFKWTVTSAQAAQTRAQELANIRGALQEMAQLAQLGVIDLAQDRWEFDHNEAIKQMFIRAGVPDTDNLFRPVTDSNDPFSLLEQESLNGPPDVPGPQPGGEGPLPPGPGPTPGNGNPPV